MSRKILFFIATPLGLLLLTFALLQTGATMLPDHSPLLAPPLTPIEELGKALYFDENLSKNGNQSCATCHDPAVGYTGPDSAINAHGAVYPGSDPSLFGNRKPPSAAYAGDSPALHIVI